MTDKRGNQTGYDLELPESGELSSVGDLYNPGYPDSGKEPRDPKGPVGFNQGQDISRAAKVTLGNYLSNSTRGNVGQTRPNTFQVPPDSAEAASGVDPSLTSRRPALARGDIETNGVTMGTYLDHAKGFTDTVRAARRFESTKDSEYGRDSTNPFVGPDVGVKSYSDPEARRRGQDGNSILLNVEPRGDYGSPDLGNPRIGPLDEGAPIVQRKISEVLKQNRFNPIEKAFIQNHTLSGPGTTLQRRMGSYVKDDAPEISQQFLKEVGLKLMVRATGHSIPGLDLLDKDNSLKVLNNTAPFLPSAPQLTGLPLIDTVNLRAGNVAVVAGDSRGVGVTPESARSEYINEAAASFEGGPEEPSSTFAGKSYGVLNSHIEPFSGGLPIGTFTTTLAGIIAIVGSSLLITMIPLILNRNKAIEQPVPLNSLMNMDPSTLAMGRHAPIGGGSYNAFEEFIFNLLGIPKINHRWEQCLLQGIGAFFGVGINPDFTIDGAQLAENIFYLATAPGYYAVVIRNAIRDTEQIVRAIEDFATAGAAGNGVAIVSGIFKLIESITSSALYRFFMAMTALGNQVLNQNADLSDFKFDGRVKDRGQFNLGGGGSITQRFTRDMGKPSGLKWKHSASPSLYILPSSFDVSRVGMAGLDSKEVYSEKGLLRLRSKSPTNLPRVSRISPSAVKQLEHVLDAEFVPFYFHDLRTNEIISFHAFLGSLSDSYDASYTNTAGYGRTDEVMIYGSTKRSISFDFVVAATSEEDLDVMYWNINKLVSMLYPQYSRGRTMVNGDMRFVQPFSQIPTASPMIRVRIGDMVKSNYSKFGLSRIFGLGQNPSVQNMRVDPSNPIARSQLVNAKLAEAILPLPIDVDSTSWEFSNRVSYNATPQSIGRNISTTNPSGQLLRFANWFKPDEPYEVIVPTGISLSLTTADGMWNGSYTAYREAQRRLAGTTIRRIAERRSTGSNSGYARSSAGAQQAVDDILSEVPRTDITFPAGLLIKGKIIGAYAADYSDYKTYVCFYFMKIKIDDIPSNIKQNLPENAFITFAIDSAPDDEFAPVVWNSDIYVVFAAVKKNGNMHFMPSAEFKLTDETITRIRTKIESEVSGDAGAPSPELRSQNDQRAGFFDASGNPIVRAFESTRGRGLAGFITQLQLDHADSTWETKHGSIAPKMMKLSVNFAPIHDLPLGLDSDGMMKSVAYNVGDISTAIGGDVYPVSNDISNRTGGAISTAEEDSIDSIFSQESPVSNEDLLNL